MPQPSKDILLANARALRRDMTSWERKLWYLFLRNYPVKIYKQHILGPYIVDFYCAAAKLVMELDGSQHYEDEAAAADEAGIPLRDIVIAATLHGAVAAGTVNQMGTISVGKQANLIAVSGELDENFEKLEAPAFVMNRGAVLRRTL